MAIPFKSSFSVGTIFGEGNSLTLDSDNIDLQGNLVISGSTTLNNGITVKKNGATFFEAGTNTNLVQIGNYGQVNLRGYLVLAGDVGTTGESIAMGTSGGMMWTCAWPVGSIFISYVNTNPSSLLGFGTWIAFGAGRVLVGYDGSDSDFNSAGQTGGEKKHTLTIQETPSHDHPIFGTTSGSGSVFQVETRQDGRTQVTSGYTGKVGGGQSHNNLQPYIVVYMWRRTA